MAGRIVVPGPAYSLFVTLLAPSKLVINRVYAFLNKVPYSSPPVTTIPNKLYKWREKKQNTFLMFNPRHSLAEVAETQQPPLVSR